VVPADRSEGVLEVAFRDVPAEDNAGDAREVVAAPGTVGKHLEHIYEKLGVHTRTAAAEIARARPAAAA
jgi:ATP/maltotriose-dependent transcriptional regulator MalT